MTPYAVPVSQLRGLLLGPKVATNPSSMSWPKGYFRRPGANMYKHRFLNMMEQLRPEMDLPHRMPAAELK